MKFEEFWPRGFRGEVVQMCKRTDGQTDGRRTKHNLKIKGNFRGQKVNIRSKNGVLRGNRSS